MSDDTPTHRFRENAVEIASTLVTGVWLGALLLGMNWWWVAMLLGYVVVIPIVATLFGDEDETEWWNEYGWESQDDWWGQWGMSGSDDESASEETPSPTTEETPLQTLRRRYAAGELTDAQFEAKLERVLETDTLENVEERAARRERDRLRERETERE